MQDFFERFLTAARSPIWAGFLAVLLIGVGIFLLGDFLLRREVTWGVESQQERDVSRINLLLHDSGLDLASAGARERLPDLVVTDEFDATFRRGLFGMDVGGAGLYSLDGAILYSTDAVSALADDAGRSPEFATARDGEPAARSRAASVSEGAGSRIVQVVETFGLMRNRPPGGREAGSALAGIRSLRDFYERMVSIELDVGEEAETLEPPGESAIPAAMRLGVYRITELALGNVVKHASASTCTLRWDYNPADAVLTLAIEDDGAGFDTGADEGAGLGLMIMNDYADSMGGDLTITSAPGEGTRVEATIPFEADSPLGPEDNPY